MMRAMMTGCDIRLRNDLGEIERARYWLDEKATRLGLKADTVFAVQLCVEEVVSNLVKHAFSDGEEHKIILSLEARPDTLNLTITDDGSPFDPILAAAPEPPTSLTTARIGGFGLRLIRHFTSAAAYERCGETNQLTLVFAR